MTTDVYIAADETQFYETVYETDDDVDSIASFESDGGQYPVEKILTEFIGKNGHVWYLVKWKSCPLVRSSWECQVLFDDVPWVYADWLKEKQKQAEGKSVPFDVTAFNAFVLDVETAEKQKRRLRRLKKAAQGILEHIRTA